MTLPERAPSPSSRKAYAIQAPTLREVKPGDGTADLDATLPVMPVPPSGPEVLLMRCLGCQGTVERGKAPVSIHRGGCRFSWKDVPAWICSRCGAAYFERSEVEQIQRAVNAVLRRE